MADEYLEGILRRRFYTGEPGEHEAIQEATKELKQLTQQIVARIKKNSKYYGQTAPGEWFDVRFITDRTCGYSIKGNNNQYRLVDVAIGVRLEDGSTITLKG